MSQRFRIIDGYNLMHSIGFAKERYGLGGLERSRNRLLRFLANRLDFEERRRTTIVFDARKVPFDGVPELQFEEMTVLFNAPGSDADTLIEELIRQHSAPRQLEVVSGDRRLQKAIRRRRGIVVDSDDFARMLQKRESIVPGSSLDVNPDSLPSEASDGALPMDADYWLKVFGDSGLSDLKINQPDSPPSDVRQSEWDAHVKELMDDLDGDDPD